MSNTENSYQNRLIDSWIEIGSAVLLAFATILSAWCAYQSVRWDGVQIQTLSQAAADRVMATNLYDKVNRKQIVQVQLFSEYIAAKTSGNHGLAKFFESRFPPPLKAAFKVWIANKPFSNANAPLSPFDLPQYKLKETDQAEAIVERANKATSYAQDANQTSDNYTLLTVIFAFSLFFGGIATKFRRRSIQLAFVIFGWITVIITAFIMLGFPVE